MNKAPSLKDLICSPDTLVVPDAYDALSAKIIQECGFKAIQCSGHSIALSKGIPAESELSLEINLATTREIVDAVEIPVMADGEDGYGNDLAFESSLEAFHRIGVSGINIEDQDLRNPLSTLRLIDREIAIEKIRRACALKSRIDAPHWIINARTDALRSTADRVRAITLAIDRANHYLDAGADLVFVAYVETLDEIKLLVNEIDGPLSIAAGLSYNADRFSVHDCIDLGVARVSLPTLLISHASSAMRQALLQMMTASQCTQPSIAKLMPH